jgi:tripartite-type tricarboxylate transporter receptor subunit TctC
MGVHMGQDNSHPTSNTRRDVLRTVVTTGTVVGLAGCSGDGGDGNGGGSGDGGGSSDGGDGNGGGSSDGDDGNGGGSSDGGDGNSGGSSDGFPSQDVRTIIPYGAGGSTDTVVRNIKPAYEENIGVDMTVDNIPGANTVKAQLELANSEPDGHTIMATSHPGVLLGYLITQPDAFDATEFKQIGTIAESKWVPITNPDDNVQGYEDLLSRFESGEYETITTSVLGSLHLLLRVLREKHGLTNYRLVSGESSSQQAQLVASGEVDLSLSGFAGIAGLYNDGTIDIPFAFHSNGLPGEDLPTVVDEGYENVDSVAVGRRTLQTPPGVSDEKIEAHSSALKSTLQDAEVKEWANETGIDLAYQNPSEAQEYYNSISELSGVVDFEAMRKEAEEAAE